MKRSEFIKLAGGLAAAGSFYGDSSTEREKEPKMHLVTLSFDDGFRKSVGKIAGIYEQFGLSACFNVIATGHRPDFKIDDKYQEGVPKGDFSLWNELQARGHEIMPHGYKHANLKQAPFEEAKGLILGCLEIFRQELAGFDSRKAVFNFPFNASTPELEKWLPTVVMAFRTAGDPINALPHPGMTRLNTTGFGPGNCEKHLDGWIDTLLARPGGWLVYNLHGLDEEGWGPIRTVYLERLLERLVKIETVGMMPAGRALLEAAGNSGQG